MLQWCRLFKHRQNLYAPHCVAGLQTVYAVCQTYLPGTVLQWCRLFKQCQNLPAGHCVTVVQAV